MKYVYVTEVEGEGQNRVLDIFKNYEKARDFIIEKANYTTINCEDSLYVDKVYEVDGERCTVEVIYSDYDSEPSEYDDDPIAKYSFYVYRRELK